MGFQYASSGLRHAGGFQWYGPGSSYTREYLMVKLIQDLQAGENYEVALKYARADGYRYAVDRLSVYLGQDSVFENHPNHLTSVVPQVHLMDPNEPYLIEGDSWVQLTDTFVAQGGERWMVIGTFLGPNDVNGTVASPSSTYDYAYYFIDDVSVREVGQGESIEELQAWPNGSGLSVSWSGSATIMEWALFDARGRVVWHQNAADVSAGRYELRNLPALDRGVYVLKARAGSVQYVARFVM